MNEHRHNMYKKKTYNHAPLLAIKIHNIHNKVDNYKKKHVTQ